LQGALNFPEDKLAKYRYTETAYLTFLKLMKFYFLPLLIAVCAGSITASAQATLKLSTPYGPFAAGLKDTTVYNKNEQFRMAGYKGPKPFFIKLWYPSSDHKRKRELYRDLFPSNQVALNPDGSILKAQSNIYIKELKNYGFCTTLGPEASPSFGDAQKAMFEELMISETLSAKDAPIAKGKMPCVIVHQGSGSFNFDNHLLCEYLASHGYVVVSSNFEWPENDEDYTISSDPISLTPENDNLEFVTRFAQSLAFVDQKNMFGVGHSWGAQSLILFDSLQIKPFKKIFLLHTTTEHRTEESLIETFPYLYRPLQNEKNNFSTRSYVFAPERPSPSYLAFLANRNTRYTFINVRQPISHDGFTTIGNVRHFFAAKYKLSEVELLKLQFASYNDLVLYILNSMSDVDAKYEQLYDVTEEINSQKKSRK
jgi:hypothetical protein